MVQFAGEAYSEGIEVVERDQVALEALRGAWTQRKATADELWH